MNVNDYEMLDLLAVQWNDQLAARFPNVNHSTCRQLFQHNGEKWVPYEPVRCIGWHCHKCGEQTNLMGHHTESKECKA